MCFGVGEQDSRSRRRVLNFREEMWLTLNKTSVQSEEVSYKQER